MKNRLIKLRRELRRKVKNADLAIQELVDAGAFLTPAHGAWCTEKLAFLFCLEKVEEILKKEFPKEQE